MAGFRGAGLPLMRCLSGDHLVRGMGKGGMNAVLGLLDNLAIIP